MKKSSSSFKKYSYLGIGAIIVIVISLNVFKKDRYDEYSCMYTDGSGPSYVTILNDYVETGNFFYTIKKETSERIEASVFEGDDNEINVIFFKRTKKLKKEYRMNRDIILLTCSKLN